MISEDYVLRVTPNGNEKWIKRQVEKADLKCTASIIDKKYLLTAGHCLKKDGSLINLTNYTIITGSSDLNRNNPNEKFKEYTFDQSDVIVHPLYKGVSNQLYLTGGKETIDNSKFLSIQIYCYCRHLITTLP